MTALIRTTGTQASCLSRTCNSTSFVRTEIEKRSTHVITNDDFTALRLMALRRWVQGREIEWKANLTWIDTPLNHAALEAGFRMVEMRLAENFTCCATCGEVFQLTAAGRARLELINSKPGNRPADPKTQNSWKNT